MNLHLPTWLEIVAFNLLIAYKLYPYFKLNVGRRSRAFVGIVTIGVLVNLGSTFCPPCITEILVTLGAVAVIAIVRPPKEIKHTFNDHSQPAGRG